METSLRRRLAIAALATTALAGSAAAGVAATSHSSHETGPAPVRVIAFETASPYCGYAYSPAACDDHAAKAAHAIPAAARRYRH